VTAVRAALLLVLLVAGSAHAGGPSSPSPHGVNGSSRGLPDALTQGREAGFGWLRVFIFWSAVQPTPAPPDWDAPTIGAPCGNWPLESARQIITEARAAGYSVIVNLFSTPCWATPAGGSGTCLNKAPTPQAFQTFAAAIAAEFGDQVAVWELWNEPNFDAHWTGSPEAYRDTILVPGYDGIKSADPDARVAGPTLMLGGFYSPEKTSAFDAYLLDGGKLARPIDVLTFHAYDTRVDGIRRAIAAPHAFADAHGIPEVWMTEFGWSLAGQGVKNACPHCASETACGDQIDQVLGLVGAAATPRFTRAFLYSLHDRVRPTCELDCLLGLVAVDGVPKPRYGVVQSASCPTPGSCPP
jgi:hypothetical protein